MHLFIVFLYFPQKCYSRFEEDDDTSSHSSSGTSPDPCFNVEHGAPSKKGYGAVQETSFNNAVPSVCIYYIVSVSYFIKLMYLQQITKNYRNLN